MAENIKDYIFENLPDGSDKWIVVGWGKVVNERTGSYDQEIVLKRFQEHDQPSKIWDLTDASKLVFCKMNLGSLRVFTPGTIVQEQKIFRFVHEYLKRREIKIDDPQSLSKIPFRRLYDPIFPSWERNYLVTSIDRAEARLLEGPKLNTFFPCNVIADYYCYGTTYFTKAQMEGRISSRFCNGNDVYNPNTLSRKRSPTGKMIVRVQLQPKMSYKDQFKIARLAHDSDFRTKCLDISTSIRRGTIYESYVDIDFPVEGPITLSVYGVEVRNTTENFFLVHSISTCSAKAPFDLIIVGKKFVGKSVFEDTANGSGDGEGNKDQGLGISPRKPGKPRRKVTLNKNGKTNIGENKPLWNGNTDDLAYERDQSDNFPDHAAVNEKDFSDPGKKEELDEILRRFGFAGGLTTNPNKSGAADTLQLSLFASGPAKSKPAPPTQAFEIIEDLAQLVEESLRCNQHRVSSEIRCPVPQGIDKYSAFPVDELMARGHVKSRDHLNFCFKNVREKQHNDHRRVFVCQLTVDEHTFYLMDIEPKYKVLNDKLEVKRLVASFGVIFHSNDSLLTDQDLISILKHAVISFGKWEFLKSTFGFKYLRIQHRSTQLPFNRIIGFIARTCREAS